MTQPEILISLITLTIVGFVSGIFVEFANDRMVRNLVMFCGFFFIFVIAGLGRGTGIFQFVAGLAFIMGMSLTIICRWSFQQIYKVLLRKRGH